MLRSPTRSVYGRVTIAVVVAGVIALALATLGIAWVVGDDQEAALVENAIRRAESTRATIAHRVALARAELRAVGHSADAGRILEAPSLVSTSVLAIRCVRDGAVLLDATSAPEAGAALEQAARSSQDGVSLVGRERLVVRASVASLEAAALIDLSDLLVAAPGESVTLSPVDPSADTTGTLVARRFVDARGEELVRVTAPVGDGLALGSTTSLAPARRAALRTIQRVSVFSSLAVVPLLLLAWLGARAVTRPLRALAASVRQARGDAFDLPALPRDEIGDLGAAIHGMSSRLRHNAKSLRAAVAFSRRLNGLSSSEAILSALEAALTEALPEARWQVMSAARLAQGERPAGVSLATDALQRLLVSARTARESSDGGTSPFAAQALLPSEDGRSILLLGLCDASRDHGLVAGSGHDLADELVRHAELLARTATAALRNQELVQMALTNERLLAVGRLAAGVAHEMNNPLAFVLANLQSVEPKLAGTEREAISDARQGAERLARIVRDLSSLSRGGDSLHLVELDLTDLARFAVRMASGRRAGPSVELDAPEPVTVRADRGRLEQVLLNLVVNAIDATRDRPSPRVQIRVRREGDRGVAEVVDNGTGVPAAARGQLFAPFFTTKGSEGTGLGLYLSRSFAQAHGGDLELARTSEHGSTFALHIPAITPSRVAPAPRQPTPIPARPSAARVLVVDDEGAIVRGITRWIGKRAQVTGCCDPVEALELASRGDYALILCDLDMPRMTGVDFVRALEQRNAETASRVVIMTGGDASSVAPTIRVVPKPLSPNLLEELLRAA